MKGMHAPINDHFGILREFAIPSGMKFAFFSLDALEKKGFGRIQRLPFSIRIVLESLARNFDGKSVTEDDVRALAGWKAKSPEDREVPFKVSRILMQDFTGVPALVDMAAMRDYVFRRGKSPERVEPVIPVDLVIDHSVQVDSFNSPKALEINQKMEMERNTERYKLLKWGHHAFRFFRVFPPSAGICHQVNLEHIAKCVVLKTHGDKTLAFPDTLVGTDSHTTMIDAIGIVGFGVGGIEAEAALLGEPVPLTMPKVLGVRLNGKLREGATATDFALTMTRLLREKGVVNMFVEFFGEGVKELSVPDRATLSNMCPEYGATIAIFPVDEETLKYLKATGRDSEHVALVKAYFKAQKMFGIDYNGVDFSDVVDVDLASIEPCVSGPSQPKQEVPLSKIREDFVSSFLLGEMHGESRMSIKDYTRWSSEGFAAHEGIRKGHRKNGEVNSVKLAYSDGYETTLSDGDVVISSITSCTNTSNPSVMIGAGILARKAVEKGLKVDTRKVKTSFGPGSRVVVDYLKKAGLMKPLEELGYGLVGFGCITCIGNSGPLIEKQSDAINKNNLDVVAVLSGNRNYEARIHRDVRANYLMSPPLLIAFAIAGTVLRDLTREPLGKGSDGRDVFLKDIWPSNAEIEEIGAKAIDRGMFVKNYGTEIHEVNPYWNKVSGFEGELFSWNTKSTYINLPPFFEERGYDELGPIENARVLAAFGDSVSTDHISPAGAIGVDSPAGRYLISEGVKPYDFNSYGARRGSHEVMVRGTFANNRLENLMVKGKEGGFTTHYPDGKIMSIFDAAMKYKGENVPLIVIAGKEYGSGSSRDWAAKGPRLLGVRAVVAESYERIHRSNLVGMGILPLQFSNGDNADRLHLDLSKPLGIAVGRGLRPGGSVTMTFISAKTGREEHAPLKVRIDTAVELEYYKAGGILKYVASKMIG